MGNVTFRSTYMAMKVLEKLIKAKTDVRGLEHLPGAPTLFVVNHFTRSETFILPYIIYKATGKFVCSLTDGSLFRGKFGQYLGKLGAVSTTLDKQARNQLIIRDLITGQNNWVIYPEGMMVKNKSASDKNQFRIQHQGSESRIHTGAATLALLAEMYRHEYWKAEQREDYELMRSIEKQFSLSGADEISPESVVIVPVTITYYPLRPGQNILKNMVKKFLKSLPERLEEELEVEGNLLLSETDITFYFGKPLSVRSYLGKYHFLRKYVSWVLSPQSCTDMTVMSHRKTLTEVFMKDIYEHVCLNFDHMFCLAMDEVHHFRMPKHLFLKSIYVAVQKIRKVPDILQHHTLGEELLDMLFDSSWEPLRSIEALAKTNDVLEDDERYYRFHKLNLTMSHVFHAIRLKNTIRVISNEARALKYAVKVMRDQVNAPDESIEKALVKAVHEEDSYIYHKDYEASYHRGVSKAKDLGQPFWLKQEGGEWGVVLCHGYLSMPVQMKEWALHLHAQGFHVYVVRLKGHGTVPEQLKHVTMEDWGRSFDRGYAVLKHTCKHVVFGGFSLGGMVALWKAAQHKEHVNGVMVVNPPVKLRDIKSHLVSSVEFYNNVLDKINVSKVKFEYVDNDSETPEWNYHKNYVKGIVQLNRTVEKAWGGVPDIQAPTLIVQADRDPVVHPQSAQMIYERLTTKTKQLKMLSLQQHNIMIGPGAPLLFEESDTFLRKVKAAALE